MRLLLLVLSLTIVLPATIGAAQDSRAGSSPPPHLPRSEGVAPAQPKGAAVAQHHKLAAAYSAKHAGVSLLVMIEGEVVFEDYPTRFDADDAHLLASGTKSFVSAMAVRAQMDGLLTLEEPLGDTIHEWEKDDPRRAITIRQLLSLSSGLDPGDNFRPPPYASATNAKRLVAPDTRFAYGPAPFQLFGEILRRKLATSKSDVTDPVAYLKKHVLDPIGLRTRSWSRGSDGNPYLPHGAQLTAREWAKYGELVRRKGKWGDQQVLDESLLDACFVPSRAQPYYGVTWWLPAPRRGTRTTFPDDLVLAAGMGGQKLWISRSNKLVIVRQATVFNRAKFIDDEFLSRLFHGTDRRAESISVAPDTAALRFVAEHDKNGDEILTADDLPVHLVPRFDAADKDADGRLTVNEVAAALKALR